MDILDLGANYNLWDSPQVKITLRSTNEVCKIMMQEAAEREDYLEAAKWRDRIRIKGRHPVTLEPLDTE